MAILVRTAVVKLQGEGRGEELREGASHSLLVKTFTDSHVVGYNVSNNEVDTFQSMPVEVTIKSFAGVSSKDIKVSARVKKGKFSKFSIS